MNGLVRIEDGDRELVRIVDAAVGEAARRSGPWVVCRRGCTQCCLGPFAITQLDAGRLKEGLRMLEAADPYRAERVKRRAARYVAAIGPQYPGDPVTGALADAENLPPAFDDEACPALDPETGCCDLYSARPITCRTFGPAVRTGDQEFAVCELCYEGATEQQTAACAVEIDPDRLEYALLTALEARGVQGMTIVAFALANDR